MTNEEALRNLKQKLLNTDMPNTISVAMYSIEKQIPKPLDSVSVFGGARCGECYTWIDEPDGINYCPYCGQRIDWEEDETC